MIKIIPSLASANQLFLAMEIDRIKEQGRLHIDIEDGNFIPNITFGIKTVKMVASYAQIVLDAHLLVTNPENYIDDLINCGVKDIVFHIEATSYPAALLNKIRRLGGKAGLAMNLKVNVSELFPYIDYLDYVLLMTSEPDDFEQKFNPRVVNRIIDIRQMLPKKISVMVDGGIGGQELTEVVQAGADIVIMGRALWNASDPLVQYYLFLEQVTRLK